MDVASLASLNCYVIRSSIGNIVFSFMFHCMNLVDCIIWICLLVPFLVMCGFIFPTVFSKALLFRKEMAIGPARVMWLE